MSDSWNDWLSYLRTMDETRFFLLYRHYLGEFPRPFNKTQLATNLLSFIREPKINRAIRLGLQKTQRQLLTLIKVYLPISKQKLISLWQNSVSQHDADSTFEKVFDNLEKKLLVYETPIRGVPHVFPSPAVSGPEWEEWLNPYQLCRGRSLEPDENVEPFSELPWVVGLFLIDEYNQLNLKTFQNKFSKIFNNNIEANHLLEELLNLRLIHDEEDKFEIDWVEWQFLAQKSPTERLLYLLVAQNDFELEAESVQAVAQLVEQLPRHLCFTPQEFLHVFVWATADLSALSPWAEALRSWLLTRLPPERLCLMALPPANPKPRLTANPNHEFIAEHCDLSLGMLLAQCSRLIRVDRVLVTQLDQQAVNRFLQRGGNINELIVSLEKFTKAPLPQNIAFTLKQWAEQYHFVSVRHGVLVTIKDQLLPLFKSYHPESYPGVIELDQGSYFFSQDSWFEFCQKTKKLPWNREPNNESPSTKVSAWQLTIQQTKNFLPPPPAIVQDSEPSLSIESELNAFLQHKPEGLQRLAFSTLAKAGLIVSVDQFIHLWEQCAPLEISGMNHQGKIHAIVEAIQFGNKLLVIEHSKGPDQKEVYQVRPVHLNGRTPSATLETLEFNTNQRLTFVLSKILRLIVVKIDI